MTPATLSGHPTKPSDPPVTTAIPANPTPPPGLRAQAAPQAVVALPSGQEEARTFWRMRRRLAATFVRQALSRSRLRLSLIVILSGLLWLGLFWLFADGFQFLRSAIPDPDTHDAAVRAVFGMFFAALMVMLVFSSGIILYSSLFWGRDVVFLLTSPARVERVFLHKFQEALLLSSWAFLLLGSPTLLAYGIVAAVPWYYFVLLGPFLIAFIYIPAAIGAVLSMLIVYRLPRLRRHLLVIAGGLVLAGGLWVGWSWLVVPANNTSTAEWFQTILDRMRLSEQQLLPSWWLSSGLLEAARGEWEQSTLFLGLMVSNALFCRQAAIWTAGRIYRAAYSGLHTERVSRKQTKASWIDQAVVCLAPLPIQIRLLVVKDLRLFRRDPVQWSQFLIFFGLLALYFFNTGRLCYDIHYLGWNSVVSLLNLSVVGLLLSTFTTRFIFPMVSLEGRRFWILGLLPLRRETILWSKFLFAAAGSIVPCSLLVLLSDLMLHVKPLALAVHQLTCVLLSLGLSGIAVGLGARMPNLREQSPSRIAAGFGGTLCLVLSALYISAMVTLTALPCHVYLVAAESPAVGFLANRAGLQSWIHVWLFLGIASSILLGALATIIPLRMGLRAFREMEF